MVFLLSWVSVLAGGFFSSTGDELQKLIFFFFQMKMVSSSGWSVGALFLWSHRPKLLGNLFRTCLRVWEYFSTFFIQCCSLDILSVWYNCTNHLLQRHNSPPGGLRSICFISSNSMSRHGDRGENRVEVKCVWKWGKDRAGVKGKEAGLQATS